jgi:hypothetical protein
VYGEEDAVEQVAADDDLISQVNGYRTLGLVFCFNIAKTVGYQADAKLEEDQSDAAAARSVIDTTVFSSGRLDLGRRRGDQRRFPQQRLEWRREGPLGTRHYHCSLGGRVGLSLYSR